VGLAIFRNEVSKVFQLLQHFRKILGTLLFLLLPVSILKVPLHPWKPT